MSSYLDLFIVFEHYATCYLKALLYGRHVEARYFSIENEVTDNAEYVVNMGTASYSLKRDRRTARNTLTSFAMKTVLSVGHVMVILLGVDRLRMVTGSCENGSWESGGLFY